MSDQSGCFLLEVFEAFCGCGLPAYHHIEGDLSFSELYTAATEFGYVLVSAGAEHDHTPIMIYGHKNRRYLIAYWACILAGRPLIPIEPDIPVRRIEQIRDQCGSNTMLDATSDASAPSCAGMNILPVPLNAGGKAGNTRPHELRISDSDIMYILFSTGTCGNPKGIRLTYGNVVDFLHWLRTCFAGWGATKAISGNIRFCFDVSLYELWTSWILRKPICSLDYSDLFNSRKYIERLANVGVTTWISTPTLVRRYLADRYFCGDHLPSVNTFIFGGEVLSKGLVLEIWRRFNGATVINTYGPAECTVSVSSVHILRAHVDGHKELPIGYVRAGTEMYMENRHSSEDIGEIVIKGRAVGQGYVELPEPQLRGFQGDGTYRTGDLGQVEDDGLWYFRGRLDREHKIQGFRVDLDDVEAHIRRLAGVVDVVTNVYHRRGEPTAIVAYVLGPEHPSDLQRLAEEMGRELPKYLIPRFWFDFSAIPLNRSSKLDMTKELRARGQSGPRYVFGAVPSVARL